MKDRKCDRDASIVSSLEVVVFFTSTLNKEFGFVLTQFKTIVMERIRKPLHYILVVYTSTIWMQLHWLSAPAFGFMTGGPKMWLAHLPYSQKQVPLGHRSSVRTTLVYIYKREPRRLFARVCTIHTLAAIHICYTLEAQRSFARVCYIHSLSPSLHQI